MQVHVTNISTANRRVCEAYLGIEVGAVQVDLTAIVMDDLARLEIPSVDKQIAYE